MRALKVAVVVMGALIVFGTITLAVLIARRSTTAPEAALSASVSVVLDEPEGTRIAAIAALRDRLAVQLQGGGADRVVLIDPLTGTIAGRIALQR